MTRPTFRGHTRGLVLAAVAAIAAGTAVSATPVGAAPASHAATGHSYTSGRYIVTFADDPASSYTGYENGFPATKPAAGKKLNVNSTSVKKWRSHLAAKHDSALSKVGASKVYDYTTANNGIAADLSAKQAANLAKQAGVLAVTKDKISHVDTNYSPEFLGLTAPGGIWSQLGGPKEAGKGLVVGVLDTGIWPENPYFKGGTGIPVPADWHGICQAGDHFPAKKCDDKLIGARYFYSGFEKKNIDLDKDYLSPRDGAGHGSHTSSTAAGNYHVHVVIDGQDLGYGSGMAPAAKLAMYKVCWDGKAPIADGCANSDSVAAINAAVADGVDVINYSIGGTSESDILDPVEQAFRGAANAGIFVANSAGNSGPGASTLDHPSPWLTTVAAATFRRAFQAVELGNGERYVGASTTLPLTTPAQIVTAASVKLAAASTDDAARCFANTLDPAKAAGKIIVCDRGVNARIDKGFEVQRAGGVGLVLVNVSPNSLNGDFHPVPAVHIDYKDGAKVKAYIASAGASATARILPLTPAELAAAPQVPEITDFSSRGPSTTTGGDILKPDIAAPGNDVVAAVAPPTNHGRNFDFMSGTSMASPHIAGIGALVKALHPTWTPAEIKSALMTSAVDTVSSSQKPFAQGAGFVNPNGAADPGLVYPATPNEWRQYMVGLGVQFNPPFDTLPPISGSDLNQASIAVGSLPGTTTVHRRVKNVGTSTATYTASAAVKGFGVQVKPGKLTLAPGQEGAFTVSFRQIAAPMNAYARGQLTWTDGSHRVRIPIALRPVPLAAPTEVHGDASASGSKDYTVIPGTTGPLATTIHGLVGVTPVSDSVTTGPFDPAHPAANASTKLTQVVVPAGTTAARFSEQVTDPNADLDMYVYRHDTGKLVGVSATGAGSEEVTLLSPAAATYDVYVNGFATPGGSTTFQLSNFVVGTADAGNASVTPNPAPGVQGVPLTLTAHWTGLDPAKRYLGVIDYTGVGLVTLLSVG